jgi:hypothetical protein
MLFQGIAMRISKTYGYNLKPKVIANVTVRNRSAKNRLQWATGFGKARLTANEI